MVEGAFGGDQGDGLTLVFDGEAARGRDEEKPCHLPVLVRLDQSTRADWIVDGEINGFPMLEAEQSLGEFLHLPCLPCRKIRGLQTAGVIFALGLASGIGRRGMGFASRLGQTLESGPEFGPDGMNEVGFRHAGRNSCPATGIGQESRMPMIYAYRNCDSCRKALKWLQERGIAAEVREVRETPPSPFELKIALAALGGDIRKLFNTSGADYRELGLKDRLQEMSQEEAISLLSSRGNLVKRPLFLGEGVVLAGFKAEEWAAALG